MSACIDTTSSSQAIAIDAHAACARIAHCGVVLRESGRDETVGGGEVLDVSERKAFPLRRRLADQLEIAQRGVVAHRLGQASGLF